MLKPLHLTAALSVAIASSTFVTAIAATAQNAPNPYLKSFPNNSFNPQQTAPNSSTTVPSTTRPGLNQLNQYYCKVLYRTCTPQEFMQEQYYLQQQQMNNQVNQSLSNPFGSRPAFSR